MSYSFRMGTADDSQNLFELMVDAYNMEGKPDRIETARGWTSAHPEHYLIMEEDGNLIGAMHVGDTWIQVGRCAVLKGDVGHVAIPSAMQGRGLGSELMRYAGSWMREQGYHLGRLGGMIHFYTRFGYEPFPRRFVVFKLYDFTGGAGLITPTQAYPEPEPDAGMLRPFDEARDWQAIAGLRHAFDAGRSGASRVSPEATQPANPAPPDPEALRFVYELDGQPVGFVFAREDEHEAEPEQAGFSLEMCYDPAHPEAAGLLMRQLLSRIAHRVPLRISSRLPFDENLAEALQAADVGFELIERRSAVAGNQILVVNLRDILTEIAPELEDRLAASLVADWSGVIEFALPAEIAWLRIEDGRIEVADESSADLTLLLTQAQFVKALFGIRSAGELPPVVAMALPPRERALLDALFPRTPTGSGPWG